MVLEKSDTGDIASKTLADRVWLLRLNLCQELCNLKVIPQTIYCFGLLILPQRVFPPVRLASVSLQVCFPSFLTGSPIMDLPTLFICVCFTGGIWLFFCLSSAPHVSLHFFPISSPPSFYVCFSIMCFPISQQVFFFVCFICIHASLRHSLPS